MNVVLLPGATPTKLRTWVIEAGVVQAVLAGVVVATGSQPIEWLGGLAVLLTFMHCQVGYRLAEAEGARTKTDVGVECHRWLGRYHVLKELVWCAYFALHGSWSALVGVGVFLVYPLWRGYWTRRRARAIARPRQESTYDNDVLASNVPVKTIETFRAFHGTEPPGVRRFNGFAPGFEPSCGPRSRPAPDVPHRHYHVTWPTSNGVLSVLVLAEVHDGGQDAGLVSIEEVRHAPGGVSGDLIDLDAYMTAERLALYEKLRAAERLRVDAERTTS